MFSKNIPLPCETQFVCINIVYTPKKRMQKYKRQGYGIKKMEKMGNLWIDFSLRSYEYEFLYMWGYVKLYAGKCLGGY